jgi:predicted permease
VLDHGLWQRRFAGDSAVLGREIHLDAEPYVVIGVSPPGFTGAELERRDAWIPMSLSRNHPEWPTTWNAVWLDVVARLKPGVSADVAAREATQILRRDYPEPNEPEAQALYTWRPISYSGIGREPMQASVSRWLTAVALVVLLIAAANVTNLVLARLIRRRREFAVRLALGVSAGRLTSMVLAESVALALGGAAAGLALAWLAGGIVRRALSPNVVWGAATLDGRLASLAVGLALLTGLIVAVVPAWQARRLDLTHTLKAGSRQAGGDRSRLRATLLMVQCALSVLLVTGAGLFVRSFWKAQHLDLGYEPDAALVADVTWPAREINTQAQRDAWRREVSGTYGAALENVRALPEVRHAALAVGTPFGFGFAVWLRVPGFDSIPRLPGGGPYIQAVTAQYFEATGMRLLGGRTFGSQDHATSERVAIVNATMAQTLWPGEPALGRCLQIFDASRPCARIVGVVGDSRRDALREPAAMQYFVPYGQETGFSGPVLVVRPAGDMRGAALRVQRAVQAIAPAALRVNVFSMREAVDPHVRPWRLGATLFLVFGGLALAIAALGLYSVISYSVAQQAHEFGVRLALGSGTSRIVARVTGRGLLITGVGLLVGLAAALAAGRSIEPQLFETSSRDPLVLTFTVLALLLAALAATALPARRATRVDPVVALRAD